MEVKAYRVGQVTRDEMTIYACCNLVPKEKERELDKLAKLGLVQKLNNRITVYGQYDIAAP